MYFNAENKFEPRCQQHRCSPKIQINYLIQCVLKLNVTIALT